MVSAVADLSQHFAIQRSDQRDSSVYRDGDLDPIAAAADDRQRRLSVMCDPHIMLHLGHVLLGRGLLGKDQGSMNLASKTASVFCINPSKVATIQWMAECFTRLWTAVTRRPVLRRPREGVLKGSAPASLIPAANFSRTPPLLPRVSRHSHALVCGARGGGKLVTTFTIRPTEKPEMPRQAW
jgi:hypothetical protein